MVVSEIVTGVASSLVFEAVRRPLSMLTTEIKRRDRINRAINEGALPEGPQEKKLDDALADLTRIIANSHGALDKNVATFIQELRRTAIPQAIANSVLCGSPNEQLLPPFEEFYARFDEMPFTAAQFFSALVVACGERINNVSDRPLLDIIRAQHRQIILQVENLTRSLNQQNTAGRITLEEVQDGRIKLSRAIEAANRYTAVESLQGAKRLRLKSLAIPSRLTPLSEGEIASAKIAENGTTITYLNFRRQFGRAVILGDPGGGKSTLTQMLCNDLSHLIALEASNPGRRDFDPSDLKLPLRVILRSFEAKNTADPSYTFFDYLIDEATLPLDNDHDFARRFLQNALSTGEAILIFDGLDEVLELGKRRNIVSLIEQFSEIYAACSILVTSRLVGYRDAPLSEDFAAYGLARFSPDEISKYAAKSIRAVSGSPKKEADAKALDFLRQSTRIGGDLRQNPLMLGLMVQIFVYRGDVPSNRPEVYKECATLMFEKWDGKRDIIVQNVPRDDMELLDVFGYVAHRTFGDASNEEGVTREWLTKELRKHFENWYIDKASANRSAKSLVEFLTGRAWVMSEVGSGVFKFTHRTFLEYFFARHLISESHSVSDLLKNELLPHVLKNEWVVISHLALHMAIFRDGGKARQAAEVISSALSAETAFPASQELALLEFIGSALDYLIIPEGVYLDIVSRLIKRAVYLGAREELAAISVVWTVFSNAGSRIHLAKRAAEEVFNRHLQGSPTPDMLFCIYVLGSKQRDSLVDGYSRRARLRNKSHGVLWSALDTIRTAQKSRLKQLAQESVAVAKAYIFAFGDMRAELYNIHGAELLEASLSPLVPPSVDQLFSASLEMASSTLFPSPREAPYEGSDCQALIRAVAADYLAGKIGSIPVPSASEQKLQGIESNTEEAISKLWHSTRRRSPSTKNREVVGEILIGISLVIEGFADEVGHRMHKGKNQSYLFAPHHVFLSLIDVTASTKFELPLRRWLDETRVVIRQVKGSD